MVARATTIAFEGVDARAIDVQVQVSSGTVVFSIVGLGDKAVAESRERIRSALIASGLALPAKRITVNLGAGGSAQGRQPLRLADRPRGHGRDRRHSA